MKTTIIAGIDVASASFVVTVIDFASGKRVLQGTYENALEGIDSCVAEIAKVGVDLKQVLFCMEHTGVYGETLCYVLSEKGFQVAMVAPEKVRRSAEDPKHKTDAIDNRRIAEYAWRYADRLRPWQPNDTVVQQINILLRTREQLVKQRTASGNLLKAIRRKWVQTPPANQALERTIAYQSEEIVELEKQIRQLINDNPALSHGFSLLVSIPGVGLLLAANMLVLTLGFTTKRSYRQLATYLGIAPRPYESGTSVKRATRSRGYGPSSMRQLLHMSARAAQRCNSGQRAYFLRKKAEGKSGRLIMNNLANKQLRLMCAVLKNNQPFYEDYRSINPALLTKP